jgi:hypothetical protein
MAQLGSWLDLHALRTKGVIVVLNYALAWQLEAEMTKLMWHRLWGPRRARCSRGGVEALLPVLASFSVPVPHKSK